MTPKPLGLLELGVELQDGLPDQRDVQDATRVIEPIGIRTCAASAPRGREVLVDAVSMHPTPAGSEPTHAVGRKDGCGDC
jgi:hypothetical protein